MKEEVKFNKYKDNIKIAKTKGIYEDPVITLLISYAFNESKTFEALLNNVEELGRYTSGDTITASAKELK